MAFGCQRLEPGVVYICRPNSETVRGQGARDGTADPAGGSGYDRGGRRRQTLLEGHICRFSSAAVPGWSARAFSAAAAAVRDSAPHRHHRDCPP